MKKEALQTGNQTNKKPTTLNDQDKFMERLLQGTPMLDSIVPDDTDSIILIAKTAQVSPEKGQAIQSRTCWGSQPNCSNYKQSRYIYFAKIK